MTHTHTQRLNADCNEMSNQLCQIACLPEGERNGRGVCQHCTYLSLLSLPSFFCHLHLQYRILLWPKERRSGTLSSPPGGNMAERSFCQNITLPLLSALASSSLRLHLREGSMWPISQSRGDEDEMRGTFDGWRPM